MKHPISDNLKKLLDRAENLLYSGGSGFHDTVRRIEALNFPREFYENIDTDELTASDTKAERWERYGYRVKTRHFLDGHKALRGYIF
jgi:hypothetical protein